MRFSNIQQCIKVILLSRMGLCFTMVEARAF